MESVFDKRISKMEDKLEHTVKHEDFIRCMNEIKQKIEKQSDHFDGQMKDIRDEQKKFVKTKMFWTVIGLVVSVVIVVMGSLFAISIANLKGISHIQGILENSSIEYPN